MISVYLLSFSSRISQILIGVTFLTIFTFLVYQNNSANIPVKENYRGVVNYLNVNVGPDDIILVSAPFTVYPIEYYYGGTARIDTIPLWDRFAQGAIPPFSESGMINQLNTDQKIYARMFVVLSYNQGYEQNIRDYMDHHYHLLVSYTFSPDLEVRVYRLRYDILVTTPKPVFAQFIPYFDSALTVPR